MRITTFKDLEAYLYSQLVLPLRRLNIPEMEFGSPMRGDQNQEWTILLKRAPTRSYRRQGPRRRAQRNSDWLVCLMVEGEVEAKNYLLASYNLKTHNVTMYELPFKVLNAMPLFGKMHDVFKRYSPFNQINIEKIPPRIIERPDRNREYVDAPDYPFDDDMEGYTEADI